MGYDHFIRVAMLVPETETVNVMTQPNVYTCVNTKDAAELVGHAFIRELDGKRMSEEDENFIGVQFHRTGGYNRAYRYKLYQIISRLCQEATFIFYGFLHDYELLEICHIKNGEVLKVATHGNDELTSSWHLPEDGIKLSQIWFKPELFDIQNDITNLMNPEAQFIFE